MGKWKALLLSHSGKLSLVALTAVSALALILILSGITFNKVELQNPLTDEPEQQENILQLGETDDVEETAAESEYDKTDENTEKSSEESSVENSEESSEEAPQENQNGVSDDAGNSEETDWEENSPGGIGSGSAEADASSNSDSSESMEAGGAEQEDNNPEESTSDSTESDTSNSDDDSNGTEAGGNQSAESGAEGAGSGSGNADTAGNSGSTDSSGDSADGNQGNEEQKADIQLAFVWFEGGKTARTLICQPEESVSTEVKNNQLSAGVVKYGMELQGTDSEEARILSISYTSTANESGELEKDGTLAVTMPENGDSNTYTITVKVLIRGEYKNFTVIINYTYDARLEMSYAVLENGIQTAKKVICENGDTETAETIYDDQLENGVLSYTMSISGASDVTVSDVKCYQSGSGRTVSLGSADQLTLLLKDWKTGENTFTVTAKDSNSNEYEFKINIPYKHRGNDTVKIAVNLTEGQKVVNGADTNLTVDAWSVDTAGNMVSSIPANGTDTKLIVKLDGEEITYISSSGKTSEYVLTPANPEVGDNNTHVLYIYAEDSYGNYGELTLNLKGQRYMAGQIIGNATVRVDMTALGIDTIESLSYKVRAYEPISYVVAKAIMGQDLGAPFGYAENTLGWSGDFSGTLDSGAYLQRLRADYSANTLDGSSWDDYGINDEEILAAIDTKFGRNTGLATLWRCIYRNELNKSSGTNQSYGEFDYTSGSGWTYTVGDNYFPGQSMSAYYLRDGDVLTLRYTLAYGWDVGGGTPGFGNAVGYCVTAKDGSFDIHHNMEKKTKADNSVVFVCSSCGIEEACKHENTGYKYLYEDTHIQYCWDCNAEIGDPAAHSWECGEDIHTCTDCGGTGEHHWNDVPDSNTATCTEGGTKQQKCAVCQGIKEVSTEAKGHATKNQWFTTETEHYLKCWTEGCTYHKKQIPETYGNHTYVWDEEWEDYICTSCQTLHEWDQWCDNSSLDIHTATCQQIVYYCSDCDVYLTKNGIFSDYHSYESGICKHCGGSEQ